MYRKLVFVLTMFAVAFGSLSQVQAALASSRPAARVASAAHAGTPASIATLRATGAVRAATAGRQMAHGARLRTEQRQGSLSLSGDRRATGRASAPKTTRPPPWPHPRSPAPISIPAATFTVGQSTRLHLYRHDDRDAPHAHCPTGAPPCRRESRSPTAGNYATLSGTPAAGTTGTYPFTITASNGGSSISTLYFTLTVVQACQITSSAGTTFTVGQAGTFTVTSTGVPTAHCPSGHTAVGSHVHRQRGRHGDTCGNTDCGLRRHIPVHDHRQERWQS